MRPASPATAVLAAAASAAVMCLALLFAISPGAGDAGFRESPPPADPRGILSGLESELFDFVVASWVDLEAAGAAGRATFASAAAFNKRHARLTQRYLKILYKRRITELSNEVPLFTWSVFISDVIATDGNGNIVSGRFAGKIKVAALWKLFDHPLEPPNQTGVTLVRKSVFVFFTPAREAPYPPAQRELWRDCYSVARNIRRALGPPVSLLSLTAEMAGYWAAQSGQYRVIFVCVATVCGFSVPTGHLMVIPNLNLATGRPMAYPSARRPAVHAALLPQQGPH